MTVFLLLGVLLLAFPSTYAKLVSRYYKRLHWTGGLSRERASRWDYRFTGLVIIAFVGFAVFNELHKVGIINGGLKGLLIWVALGAVGTFFFLFGTLMFAFPLKYA